MTKRLNSRLSGTGFLATRHTIFFSASFVSFFSCFRYRACYGGACREISRCKWLVTDPPQCRTNLRDHFPARPYFTSDRCDEERGWWWIGGPHTLRTMHVHHPAAISDRLLDSLSCGTSMLSVSVPRSSRFNIVAKLLMFSEISFRSFKDK